MPHHHGELPPFLQSPGRRHPMRARRLTRHNKPAPQVMPLMKTGLVKGTIKFNMITAVKPAK